VDGTGGQRAKRASVPVNGRMKNPREHYDLIRNIHPAFTKGGEAQKKKSFKKGVVYEDIVENSRGFIGLQTGQGEASGRNMFIPETMPLAKMTTRWSGRKDTKRRGTKTSARVTKGEETQ